MKHPPVEAWLLDYGEEFEGVERPDWLDRMQPKACLRNSYEVVLEHQELVYCEGFIVLPAIPLPIHHAWCIDPDDDSVVDPTLDDPLGVSYFGVRVPLDDLLRVIAATRTYGVLYKDEGHAMIERLAGKQPTSAS